MRRLLVLAATAAVVAAGGSLPDDTAGAGDGSDASPVPSSSSAPASTAADGDVERVGGRDRVATAAAVAREHWDTADVAVVASARDFPDALSGVPIAARSGGPLLLTEPDHLPLPVVGALDDLEVSTVVVLGGSAAVDDAVVDELERDGHDVTRIGGEDRYHTAGLVAGEAGVVGEALVASGEDFPDALSAGTLTAVPPHPPLVLTTPHAAHPQTKSALEDLEPGSAVVLGGAAAVADEVVTELEAAVTVVERRAGPDRYQTSIDAWEDSLDRRGQTGPLIVASGATFPDGLAAGALAARLDGTMLLTPGSRLTDELDAAIREHADRISRVVIIGGDAAIDPFVQTELAAALAGDDRPPPPDEPVDVELTPIASGLATPWDVVFRDDGDVLVTERDSGRVLELAADGSTEQVHRFDVDPAGEGGLLGLAEHPDEGQLYAYYTHESGNRVVRFEPGGSEEIVFDGIPHSSRHNGGRLAFGPDGGLYVATGDAGSPSRSQDATDPAGSILRLEPDDRSADDNPQEGSPVHAMGIRNSQGLAWDADGRLWASEFGLDADDEINVIDVDGNYGWPEVTGVAERPGYVDPAFVRQPDEASWSGIEVLVDGSIPQWEGDVFAAALRGERLWRLSVDGSEVVASDELLVGEHGRLREVTQAPDGSLWILTNNTDGRGDPRDGDDRILRLGPAFSGDHAALSDEVRATMQATSWEPGCPVHLDDLAHVTVDYWGFDHQQAQGELVVAADVADETVAIFADLFEARFPLERVALIDDFEGDDDAAMDANASTAFNCRQITGGTRYSEHAYGTAIDLNPRQNPYRRGETVLPPAGGDYLDRNDVRPGMITAPGPVVAAFDERGWEWGGRWSTPQDWMHFEKP